MAPITRSIKMHPLKFAVGIAINLAGALVVTGQL